MPMSVVTAPPLNSLKARIESGAATPTQTCNFLSGFAAQAAIEHTVPPQHINILSKEIISNERNEWQRHFILA